MNKTNVQKNKKDLLTQIDNLDKAIAKRCFIFNREHVYLKKFLAIFEYIYNGVPWLILSSLIYFLVDCEYWTEKALIILIGNLKFKYFS